MKLKKILFINGCMHEDSRTLQLAKHVLKKLKGEIREISPDQECIRPLDWDTVVKRNRLSAEQDFTDPMFRFARDFAAADEIVLAVPYWDMSFPAVVRTYFEAVTVCGLTFRYTEEGVPEGLCKAKRLHYVTTAGGEIGAYNLGFEYISALCDVFYKIPEVIFYHAEKLDIVGADVPVILEEAKRKIDRLLPQG